MGQIKVEKDLDGIKGLCVITPAVHGDSRGYFMETYSQRDMAEAGIDIVFVQDNQSMSTKGVLRGLHFDYYGAAEPPVRWWQSHLSGLSEPHRLITGYLAFSGSNP